MATLPRHLLARLVTQALLEDIGPGDLTCEAIVPHESRAVGIITAGEPMVLAGVDAACLAFHALDPHVRFPDVARDGAVLAPGDVALRVDGAARGVLGAERTALNLLGRMSGIATATRRCVDALSGTRALLYDTRKTTPGLRPLERYAVAIGGARNHRFGLFDALLIKDNHLIVAGGVTAAVAAARARFGGRYPVEVEVENLEDLAQALDAGADIILLDNMTTAMMREAVIRRDTHVSARGGAVPLLEASGGIGPETIAAVAAVGVDRISMGALTHSAPSACLSLTVESPA